MKKIEDRTICLAKAAWLTSLFILIMMMTSCDFFGSFGFIINNRTDKEIRISYIEQLRSTEDIFPTYDHGDDYEYYRLSHDDSTVCIPPCQSFSLIYNVGLVDIYFPSKNDTPEKWGIVPLWKRITSIVIGSDTIDVSLYSKDKWERNGSDYTLNLY